MSRQRERNDLEQSRYVQIVIYGGYRRDHLRALAQRVEVADREVRVIGSKSNLLRTLTAAAGAMPATSGVRSSV